MFKDNLDMAKFILYRYDRGFWNIPKWHFPRCCEEITQQLYAEYKGWV